MNFTNVPKLEINSRINRLELLIGQVLITGIFIAYWLFAYVVTGIAPAIDYFGNHFGAFGIGLPLSVTASWAMLSLVLTAFGWILTVRRLHDIGWSGYWGILYIVPYLNFLMFLVLVFKEGNKKENQYGPAPAPLR